MAVGGGAATATGHGGETSARATRCEKTLLCTVSKQSGYDEAVGVRWSNAGGEGPTRGELGGQQGDGDATLSCCGEGESEGEGKGRK